MHKLTHNAEESERIEGPERGHSGSGASGPLPVSPASASLLPPPFRFLAHLPSFVALRAAPPRTRTMSRPSKKRGKRQPNDDEGGEESSVKRVSRPPLKPLSPAQLCHPDHLSLAFSFLTPRNLATAIGACRSWHAGGERHTAWPSFDVARFISGLMRSPNYEEECVQVELGGPERNVLAIANLTQIVGSRVWSQARQFRSASDPNHALTLTEDHALALIEQMPQLQSLQLFLWSSSSVAIRKCFDALAPRLLCLSTAGLRLYQHVALLPHLRVLRLHFVLDVAALRLLHELEYLHLEGITVDSAVCLAVRELSAQHRLRGFSVKSFAQCLAVHIDVRVLTRASFSRVEDGEKCETSLPPAALTFVRVEIHRPVGFVISNLLELPHLDTLEVVDQHAFDALRLEHAPASDQPVSPLRSFIAPWTSGCPLGIQRLAARAPNIECLTLHSMAPAGWTALTELQSLRTLRLLDKQPLTFPTSGSADFAILAALPHFQRLAVGMQEQGDGSLTSEHLQALSRSRSWQVIELTGPDNEREWCEHSLTVALPSSLAEADMKQLQQLRVYYRRSSAADHEKVCFQLQPTDKEGEMEWTAGAE